MQNTRKKEGDEKRQHFYGFMQRTNCLRWTCRGVMEPVKDGKGAFKKTFESEVCFGRG